jgi:hypothetical protein
VTGGLGVLPRSRWASLVRAGYGTALLCNPGAMIRARTGRRPSRRACAVGRILGARHLAQAIACWLFPTRWLIRSGAAADLLHAASMLALAGEDADLRPALLTDAGIATAFATAAGAFLRQDGGPDPAGRRYPPALSRSSSSTRR